MMAVVDIGSTLASSNITYSRTTYESRFSWLLVMWPAMALPALPCPASER